MFRSLFPPPPPPLLFFSQNHLHAVCNTRIAPLSKAVVWCWQEGATSQRGVVNKLDSQRSNQALAASNSEKAAFMETAFTVTAAF